MGAASQPRNVGSRQERPSFPCRRGLACRPPGHLLITAPAQPPRPSRLLVSPEVASQENARDPHLGLLRPAWDGAFPVTSPNLLLMTFQWTLSSTFYERGLGEKSPLLIAQVEAETWAHGGLRRRPFPAAWPASEPVATAASASGRRRTAGAHGLPLAQPSASSFQQLAI